MALNTPRQAPNGRGEANEVGAWREYVYLGELYKFYLDLVVKAAGGYFLVVGGILTLVLANVNRESVLVVALLVPVLMSVLLAVAAWKARPKVRELRIGINDLGEKLDVTVKPHVEILEWGINGSSLVLLIAAIFLVVLFVWIAAAA